MIMYNMYIFVYCNLHSVYIGSLLPDKLNLTMKAEWIPHESYKNALHYLKHLDWYVHIEDHSAEDLEIYFVSHSQLAKKDNQVRRISQTVVRKFEATLRGEVPRGTNIKNFEKVTLAGLALAKVYVSEDPIAQCIECEMNLLNLKCLGCLGFQKLGMCSHVLAATHLHYAHLKIPASQKPAKHNIYYMLASLYGSRGGKRKAGRPLNMRGGLHREAELSDEEDDELSRTRDNWWGDRGQGSEDESDGEDSD